MSLFDDHDTPDRPHLFTSAGATELRVYKEKNGFAERMDIIATREIQETRLELTRRLIAALMPRADEDKGRRLRTLFNQNEPLLSLATSDFYVFKKGQRHAILGCDALATLLNAPGVDDTLVRSSSIILRASFSDLLHHVDKLPQLAEAGLSANDLMNMAQSAGIHHRDNAAYAIQELMEDPDRVALLREAGFGRDQLLEYCTKDREIQPGLHLLLRSAVTLNNLRQEHLISVDDMRALAENGNYDLLNVFRSDLLESRFNDLCTLMRPREKGGAGMGVDDVLTLIKCPEQGTGRDTFKVMEAVIDHADKIAGRRRKNGPQNNFSTAAAAVLGPPAAMAIQAAYRVKEQG